MSGVDDLVDILASGANVSNDNFSSNAAAGHPRFSNYKNSGMAAEKQARRRQEFLDAQKSKRSAVLAMVRQLGGVDIDEEEDADVEMAEGASAAAKSKKKGQRRGQQDGNMFQDQLMYSEWLIDVPDSFADEWILVACPQGKRVLVIATKGTTQAYLKNGRMFKEFASVLPGDLKSENRGSKTTVLDCVFCEELSTFYCLDIICWNGCPVFDSDTEFRFFWLQSKLSEVPSVAEKSHSNRFIFSPLPRSSCKKDDMEKLMKETFPFKLDGLLFYYKGTNYMAGQTPLVGWLKPFMLPEILGVQVPSDYMTGYEATVSKAFISDFNADYEKKHDGRQYGGKKDVGADSTGKDNEGGSQLHMMDE